MLDSLDKMAYNEENFIELSNILNKRYLDSNATNCNLKSSV